MHGSSPSNFARRRAAVFTAPRGSAFTLMELIMVLVILAIVSATVVPQLRGFGAGRRTSDTADLLVTMAHFARTQAISEGRPYRLNFDPAGRSFWLTAQDAGVYTAPTKDFTDPTQLADGVKMRTDLQPQSDGTLYVQFQPSGRSDPVHIWLTDAMGSNIEVACLSSTELFRILKAEEMTQ